MQKNLNIEKIIFKVVQMKFLAMHVTNQISFNIFTVCNLLNIFMEKSIILTHTVYCWIFLQINLRCLWLRLCSRLTFDEIWWIITSTHSLTNLCLPQAYVNMLFWYQFFCGFSATAMIDYWLLIFFNLFFTSAPPIMFGIMDKEVSASTLLSLPELYKRGQHSEVSDLQWLSLG